MKKFSNPFKNKNKFPKASEAIDVIINEIENNVADGKAIIKSLESIGTTKNYSFKERLLSEFKNYYVVVEIEQIPCLVLDIVYKVQEINVHDFSRLFSKENPQKKWYEEEKSWKLTSKHVWVQIAGIYLTGVISIITLVITSMF